MKSATALVLTRTGTKYDYENRIVKVTKDSVIVPNSVAAYFGLKTLWFGELKEHNKLGIVKISTIVGTVIWPASSLFCWRYVL